MIYLISIDDFKDVGIVLPTNQELEDWQRYFNEAQQIDVRPYLGDRLYYDLLKNSTNANYQDLLNGVEEYLFETYSYGYPGLKAALCFFAYARYLPNSGIKDTDFGPQWKRNEFSDRPDSKFIQVRVNDANSIAKSYMDQALTYLQRYATIDSTKFPLWGNVGCASPSHTGVKISKVGQVPGTEGDRYNNGGRFSDGISRIEF